MPLIAATFAVVCGYGTGADAVEIGQKAPNCVLNSLSDKQRRELQQYRGNVVYLDFWASWCGPCAQSFPFMNTLHHELRGKGLQVVGVNLDEEPEDAASFLARRPAHFNIVADAEKRCANDFGVKAMPSSYLIDRKGTVRYVHLGFRTGESGELRDVVQKLLAERP